MGRRPLSWIWLIVVLCAKEMKTHNRTYSHFIRINTWRDGDRSPKVTPLPITELLARSSYSQHSQSSNRDDIGDTSNSERVVTKRQVDPLHSCIEAKCSSWNSGNYLDCVYRHCVTGFQMHGKRSTDDDEPPAPATDSFGNPEGRFLLLPVTFQSPDVEPQLFPPTVLQSDSDDEAAQEETRRALVARARMARSRIMSASSEVQRRRRTTLGDKLRQRRKRHVTEWNGSEHSDSEVPGPLVAGLRANLLLRRSYNDIADVCVEHHCGQLPPHTISYFQCVEHHCTGKRV